jgi:hypothetical protein
VCDWRCNYFPFLDLKCVKGTFRMEYNQEMIIRFLWNGGIDVHEMISRFQAHLDQHNYELRTVWLWTAEVRFGHQDLNDEIRIGKLLLDDLDATILAIWDKSPFKSICSIAEALSIVYSAMLSHLHDSIDFRSFHFHSVPHLLMHDSREKRKKYAKRCYHSCMLSNMIVGIILWPVRNHGFFKYITLSHVDSVERWRDHKTETWYSEQKMHVYNHVESERLRSYR